MDRNLFRSMVTFVAMFILVLGVGTASAQHASKNKSDNPNQKDTFRSMSPDELKQLEAAIAPALSQSAEGLVVKDGPAGSKYVDLQGRFQSVAIAKAGSDGKVQTQCVINMNEAKDFLEKDKTASTTEKSTKAAAENKTTKQSPAPKPESAEWEVK
jgi:hypothetical protein